MTAARRLLLLLLSVMLLGGFGASPATAEPAAAGVPVCTSTATTTATRAATATSGAIGFSAPSYTANEDTGQYWVTITRTVSSTTESVLYGAIDRVAEAPYDFSLIKPTEAVLSPGQASCQFPVSIVDNGMHGPAVTATLYLSDSSSAALPANPDEETLTILRNDPLATRDPQNPLDLLSIPTDDDPLSGAQFYVAPFNQTAAGEAMSADERAGDRAGATALRFIAQQPFAYRFEYWNLQRHFAVNVAHYLELAQRRQSGRVIELSTYSLVHGALGSTANPAFTARYLRWVSELAEGIGNFRVVMLFEADSLLQSPRLTATQRRIRLVDQLKPAIEILERDPHLVLYLDAGSSDGLKATRAADYLRQAGIAHAQGFFLNSTHFDWDTTEIQQGQAISRLLGGTHFTISSGVNGRGPLLLREPAGPTGPQQEHYAEELCDPVGRGLGTMSTRTGYTGLDGLLWFAPVANSAGACRPGAPPSPDYWPAYAVALYEHRQFGVTGPRLRLRRDGVYVPYSAAFDG